MYEVPSNLYGIKKYMSSLKKNTCIHFDNSLVNSVSLIYNDTFRYVMISECLLGNTVLNTTNSTNRIVVS